MRCRTTKIVLLFVLVIFTIASSAAAAEAEHAVIFRGLAWGDPPSVLEERIETPNNEWGVTTFIVRGDRLELGPVHLTDLNYAFFQEELFRISLTFSHDDFDTVLAMMRERYGVERYTDLGQTRYEWESGDTLIVLLWPWNSPDYISIATFSSTSRERALSRWQQEEELLGHSQQADDIKAGAKDW